jgi:hypothetical protein
MSTSIEHGGMILPVGLGMGPTQLGQVTISPRRADGFPLTITDDEPTETNPGAAGGHGAIKQGTVMLMTVAAGKLLIITLGDTAITKANGIGGWGTGDGCPVWQ